MQTWMRCPVRASRATACSCHLSVGSKSGSSSPVLSSTRAEADFVVLSSGVPALALALAAAAPSSLRVDVDVDVGPAQRSDRGSTLLEHLVGDGSEASGEDAYAQLEQIDRVPAPQHISSIGYEVRGNVESFSETTAKLKF